MKRATRLLAKLHALLLATAGSLSIAPSAHAMDIYLYTAQALSAAQKEGKPMALVFHADWCPTCRVQGEALMSLKDDKSLDLMVLFADYDTEKELKRRFNVRFQSTLVVLKGEREIVRLIGETRPEQIRNALKAAL